MSKAKFLPEEALLKVAENLRLLADSIRDVYKVLAESTPEKKSEAKVRVEISLEKVRGVLADKSRNGHTSEVRAIIQKYGANRLSEIDPSNYEAILKEAEVL